MTVDSTPYVTNEMRERYVTRRRADLASAETAVAASDFETLGSIAHQIKGNASTFSFDSLEKIALSLEMASNAKSQEGCHLALIAFRAWVQAQPG